MSRAESFRQWIPITFDRLGLWVKRGPIIFQSSWSIPEPSNLEYDVKLRPLSLPVNSVFSFSTIGFVYITLFIYRFWDYLVHQVNTQSTASPELEEIILSPLNVLIQTACPRNDTLYHVTRQFRVCAFYPCFSLYSLILNMYCRKKLAKAHSVLRRFFWTRQIKQRLNSFGRIFW